ncbi:MAG: Na+/H+ antiporter NhaC family protein [Gemmatimonadota bacterium]|nr:Na+/H+ antiporter NhaC family protein [Gemmatimonadota bacterium]
MQRDSGRGGRKRTVRTAAVVGAAALAALALWTGGMGRVEAGGHAGAWSLVPPVATLVLAFALREVVAALFVGIVLGGVIAGRPNIVQEFLLPSVGSSSYALILLVYLWSLGGLIGLWTRTGAAAAFAERAAARVVRGPRSAKFFAWTMGLVFHQGGTVSTVLTGATVRPVADAHRVSHEELSYLVDSTASPAATVIPFNVWPIYVGGLVAGTVPVLADEQAGIAMFFRAIPLNFYAWIALLLGLLFAWDRLPLLPGRRMREARRRARETGALDREGSAPLASPELTRLRVPDGYEPSPWGFLLPIGTLLAVAIGPFAWSFFVLGRREAPPLPIAEAFVLALLVAMGTALARGMAWRDVVDGFISGCKGVTIGAVVLALAVTLKSVTDAVGTAVWLVETAGPWIPPVVLPGALLGLTMFVAFSTGTSWGTYAVLFPVAMPLAWSVQPDPGFLSLCFAAVTGGAVFGDQCSPISDTSILSSLATGCDLMDHVLTQLPMALFAAGAAAVLYTLLAAFPG